MIEASHEGDVEGGGIGAESEVYVSEGPGVGTFDENGAGGEGVKGAVGGWGDAGA